MHDKKIWWRQEKGFSLMELSVSLPLFAILLLSMAVLFGWGIKSFFFMVSDWQLQRDVQYSMQRISDDLTFAEKAEPSGRKFQIYWKSDTGVTNRTVYELSSEELPRIRRNSQPLTGDSLLGRIVIERMDFECVGDRMVCFHIRGHNPKTGHSYELRSAVTMLKKGAVP